MPSAVVVPCMRWASGGDLPNLAASTEAEISHAAETQSLAQWTQWLQFLRTVVHCASRHAVRWSQAGNSSRSGAMGACVDALWCQARGGADRALHVASVDMAAASSVSGAAAGVAGDGGVVREEEGSAPPSVANRGPVSLACDTLTSTSSLSVAAVGLEDAMVGLVPTHSAPCSYLAAPILIGDHLSAPLALLTLLIRSLGTPAMLLPCPSLPPPTRSRSRSRSCTCLALVPRDHAQLQRNWHLSEPDETRQAFVSKSTDPWTAGGFVAPLDPAHWDPCAVDADSDSEVASVPEVRPQMPLPGARRLCALFPRL
jgi:hypothetical protein